MLLLTRQRRQTRILMSLILWMQDHVMSSRRRNCSCNFGRLRSLIIRHPDQGDANEDDYYHDYYHELLNTLHGAANLGGAPEHRQVNPWAHQRLWYDPQAFHQVHREHFLFWMRHRSAFLEHYWSVLPPVGDHDSHVRRSRMFYKARVTCTELVGPCLCTWVWLGS